MTILIYLETKALVKWNHILKKKNISLRRVDYFREEAKRKKNLTELLLIKVCPFTLGMKKPEFQTRKYLIHREVFGYSDLAVFVVHLNGELSESQVNI